MATTITANGINFPDGSAGSPSIGGTDTNTGLFTGSDIVGFATGGSERLRIDASGNINIANDSGKLQLGTSADLKIYHDGNHSYIFENGTGDLKIETNGTAIQLGKSNGEICAKFIPDGAVELYYDNTKKFETTAAGSKISTGVLDFPDGVEARFGTGGDMKISHDGSNSKIHHGGSGGLKITTADFQVQNGAGSEWIMRGQADGAVELYYDNSKKLATDSAGTIFYDDTFLGDSLKANFGASADLQIFHDGSHSWIEANNTGNLYVGTTHDAPIFFPTNNTNRAKLTEAGHFIPVANNSYDLGTSSERWRNVYTNDLHLSNEGGANDVDGTWGSYTIQEGAEDLFLVNKRNGKKYKFNLMEVN